MTIGEMSDVMMYRVRLTEQPIDINAGMKTVIRPEAGAVSTFIGIAREFTGDKRTLFLQYEAYIPMAEKQLARICKEIIQRWPEARISIEHRIGRLDISDVAVAIVVSTPHRDAAFKACRYAIERIKEIVPIWKKEYWKDGSKWIGNQQETISYEEVLKND